jgi:hypothetical protein
MQNQLHIYEEVLLLALKDEKGTIHFGVNYNFALAGAIVAELLLKKIVEVEMEGKKKFLKLKNPKAQGDAILDECIAKLNSAKRRAQVGAWVQRFANLRRLKHRAAESLCRKGILRMEEDKVLLIFTRKLYPEINHKPEKLIMDKLDAAIFTDKKDLDAETIILISICNTAGMLKPIFDKHKLKERKARIKDITSGNVIGQATKEAIEAMQAAVMIATIVPVAVTAAH